MRFGQITYSRGVITGANQNGTQHRLEGVSACAGSLAVGPRLPRNFTDNGAWKRTANASYAGAAYLDHRQIPKELMANDCNSESS